MCISFPSRSAQEPNLAVTADQRWHYTFTAQCLSPILEAVVSPNPPPYAEVLALDARIREFQMPSFMQVAPGPSAGNGLCLVQMWTNITRDVGACERSPDQLYGS